MHRAGAEGDDILQHPSAVPQVRPVPGNVIHTVGTALLQTEAEWEKDTQATEYTDTPALEILEASLPSCHQLLWEMTQGHSYPNGSQLTWRQDAFQGRYHELPKFPGEFIG